MKNINLTVTQKEVFNIIDSINISITDKIMLNTLVTNYGLTEHKKGVNLVKQVYKIK
jgi:hypothetical protein